MERHGWGKTGVAVAACILAVAAAGAGTQVAETSGGGKTQEAPPGKILVMVVIPNPSLRAGLEEMIASELSLRGSRAVASSSLFPDLPKERGPFEAKAKAEGFDAVTVSRLVGRSDKVKWKEATTIYDREYLGRDWWGWYWFTYEQATLPGYLDKETRIRVRTDYWRTSGAGEGPAWSGTSELVDPRTLAQAAHEIAVSIVKALAKARII